MPRTSKQASLKKPARKKPKKNDSSWKSRIIGLWTNGGWLRRSIIVFSALLVLWVGVLYGIAQWYILSNANKPMKYGATFIPSYARYFDLDPKETLNAIIHDLGIKQLRLVSYWSVGEPNRGEYDFSELDWQMEMAENTGSKVSLAIGLRQPRWPECHMPSWAEKLPMSEWSVELQKYMKAVIERYKDSPALESYQLENEFFMTVFGICPDHSRERLIDEYEFVKKLDSSRPIIISRSNNAIGIPINDPQPDISAVSVYKRVWDKTITKRYFEYPFPSWFYAMLAGAGKIVNGNDMIIHELQAEAWLPEGFQMNDVNDIPEQEKSLNAKRLRDRIEYGRATGMKEMYLWGVEWWYWQKEKADKPDLWNVAKEELSRIAASSDQ